MTDPTLLSHNDDPTHQDTLGREKFIERACDLVRNCRPPKGIAINAYWGTGKTSALRRIHYQLSGFLPGNAPGKGAARKKSNIVPVWFEAWRHQHEAVPVVALLNEIRSQLDIWSKMRNSTGKLTGVALMGVLSTFDQVIKTASGSLLAPKTADLQKHGEAWEARRHEGPLPGQAITALLEQAVAQVLGKPVRDKRLVIFIDDLDRCQPAAALALLEGIKVHLNLNNCVIVFGMDQRQITKALCSSLNLDAQDDQAEHYAREYLEKICQDSLYLPMPDQAIKTDFVLNLLSTLEFGEIDSHLADLKRILDAYDCLPANPRKLKALANRLAWMLRCAPKLPGGDRNLERPSQPNTEVEAEPLSTAAAVLLVVAICYCFHRAIYEQLEKNPRYNEDLIRYATSSGKQEELDEDPRYRPMRGLLRSRDSDGDLPVNPSDSNVFRLHAILGDLGVVTAEEISPFLGL